MTTRTWNRAVAAFEIAAGVLALGGVVVLLWLAGVVMQLALLAVAG